MHGTTSTHSVTSYWIFMVIQVIFVIVFAALARYDTALLPAAGAELGDDGAELAPAEVSHSKYPRKCNK